MYFMYSPRIRAKLIYICVVLCRSHIKECRSHVKEHATHVACQRKNPINQMNHNTLLHSSAVVDYYIYDCVGMYNNKAIIMNWYVVQ